MLQAFSAGSCSGWLVHAVLFEKRRGKRKEGEEEGGGERKREMAGGRGGGQVLVSVLKGMRMIWI